MQSETSALIKFSINDSQQARHYFEENGYVVFHNLLSSDCIDNFLEEYDRIKHHSFLMYFSQSSNVCIKPKLNEYGYIKESMLDPSRLALFSHFTNQIKNCIYNPQISEGLSKLTGYEKHVSVQDMFFDLSTGTIEHQDTWYLDTTPPGSLIAAWIALENIHEDAGPFFVLPGSHKLAPINQKQYPDYKDLRKKVLQFIETNHFKHHAMPLDKGDVLFWHPFLIHGAFENKDPQFSRKSLTSHYFPAGLNYLHSNENYYEPTQNKNMYRIKREKPDLLQNIDWYFRHVLHTLLYKNGRLAMKRENPS